MANVELAMRIPASADRVWSVFAGPDMVKLLLEAYAVNVEVESGEQGTIFTTTLRDGGQVREQILSVDNDERCMSYRVLDPGPMPYANYRGEARIQPAGSGACVVSLQCSFIPVDMSEEEAREFWLAHNRHVLATLRDFIAGN